MDHDNNEVGRTDKPEVGHETRDVNLRNIVVVAMALVGLVAVVHLAGWWLFDYLDARQRLSQPDSFPLAAEQRDRWAEPPQPQLEGIMQMRGELREPTVDRQADVLRDYRWVDRDAGIIQIPIDKAMEMIVERGLLPAAAHTSKQEQAAPSRSNSGHQSDEKNHEPDHGDLAALLDRSGRFRRHG